MNSIRNNFSVEQSDDEESSLEEDLGVPDYKDVVIYGTDWTVETLCRQIEKEVIDLEPSFQRRSAWDDNRASKLVESILIGLPVPNIVLAAAKKDGNKFIVLDGKQRLLTISNFFNGRLKLQKLTIRTDLNKKTFNNLSEGDQNSFENSAIRTTVIKNWSDDRFLYLTFYRLNSGSLPLSPQELRRAFVGDKLANLIDKFLDESSDVKSLFKGELDRRMRDSELVLRFLAFQRKIKTYNGNLKYLLDSLTEEFQEGNDQEIGAEFESLNRAISTAVKIFGENSFQKWKPTEEKFENSFNKAIFDCLCRYFSHEDIAIKSLEKSGQILNAFKKVCDDREFMNAIERTTKSKVATFCRLKIWGRALVDVIGGRFDETEFQILL